jgi:hypothetical protein
MACCRPARTGGSAISAWLRIRHMVLPAIAMA